MVDRPWDLESLPVPLIPLERTFEGWLGIEWIELTREFAHVRFQIRENLKQHLGLLHGGIYSAVAETVRGGEHVQIGSHLEIVHVGRDAPDDTERAAALQQRAGRP